MINIKPSSSIRNNYPKMSEYCRETGEPIYLTNNGEGDTVLLNVNVYEELKNNLFVRAAEIAYLPQILEGLAAAKKRRDNGEKGYSLEEAMAKLDKTLGANNET